MIVELFSGAKFCIYLKMKHLVQFVYVLCLYRNLRPFSLQLTHYEARIGDDARVGDT